MNSRLDEIQAAMLSVKLKYLQQEIDMRKYIAGKYIANIRHPDIVLPVVQTESAHVWHLFVMGGSAAHFVAVAQYVLPIVVAP